MKILKQLTHAETRIYLTQLRFPESPMWNLINSVEIEGPPNPAAMQKAIRVIAANNQALRLRFADNENGPYQYDSARDEINYEFKDFISSGEEAAYEKWCSHQNSLPFNLKNSPLYFFVYAQVSQTKSFLFVKLHHLIADGGSLAGITSQLVKTYRKILNDDKVEISNFSDDFFGTLEVEKEYLNSSKFHEDEKYWQENFSTIPDPVELSVNTPGDSLKSNFFSIKLNHNLNKTLFNFCEKTHNSPFRIFLTVFFAYLSRISGKNDISIGSATNGRFNGKISGKTSGMFVNTAPLRIKAAPDEKFIEVLKKSANVVRLALNHGNYPYDLLAEHLRRKNSEIPDITGISLVQFIRPEFSDNSISTFFPPGETVNPLTIYLSYDASGDPSTPPIELIVSYRIESLTESEARNHITRILQILSIVLNSPNLKLCDLNIIPENELQMILESFNCPHKNYHTQKTVHSLIEERAELLPDKVAVVFKKKEMSYRELNSKANQLARKLMIQGVGPGSIVGLWAERSLEVITAQLAILKAGAGFMPIDVKYPIERARFMLEDSEAKVLLAHDSLIGENKFDIPVITLNDSQLFNGDDSNIDSSVDENNIFVVIYTSGSTGKPKGTVIEHKAMTNFIFATIEILDLTQKDNIAKHASFSFDASNIEIYPILSIGGTLNIIPEEIRLAIGRLNEYYEKHNISIAFFTTQFGEQFMELVDNHSLRLMLVGGEKLRTFRKRPYKLINGYGPTECTVMATAYIVDSFHENIPIGRPLPNYDIRILDAFGNLVPIGIPGELCIGGVSLARLYLNRPDKTEEVFVEHSEFGRLYHTRDLAAWLPDGNIVYLGRMDRQVKLRGYRIELGEIEQGMLAIKEIKEAAVVDLKDKGGRMYLCGYYVSEKEFNAEQLKSDLQKTIPEFMIPSRFMHLPELPVTPSGKIDRKNLPLPSEATGGGNDGSYLQPSTKTEIILAEIWSKTLQIDKISANDDFFHLGGDSLKCVAMQLEIENKLSVSLQVSTLFKISILSELAKQIDSEKPNKKTVDVLKKAHESDFYPLTESQKQLFILDSFNSSGLSYNVPFTLDIKGPLNKKQLSDSLYAIVEAFDVFRTSFELRNGKPVQIIHDDVYLKMEFENVNENQIQETTAAFPTPFDLKKPPLLKVKLLRVAHDRHILLVDTHHIISDGFSVALFLKYLTNFYNSGTFLKPQFQFKDFVVWHKNKVKSGYFKDASDYWKKTFNNIPETEMPTDFERTQNADFIGGSVEFASDSELGEKLNNIANINKTTQHHLLMAAFAVLIARYADADELIIGTTTSGRQLKGTEEIIGMFVNTLPVKLTPSRSKKFVSFLQETRDAVLKTIENAYYPIEQLYENLAINRGAGRHPLIDMNFVSRNTGDTVLKLHGTQNAQSSIIDTKTAKFDISLAANHLKDASISFHLEYKKSLYKEDTISRLAKHYLKVLEEIARNPDIKIDDISILPPDEKEFILTRLNDTKTPTPTWKTVARSFELHAKRQPDHIAVFAEGIRMSYSQLNSVANRFASFITSQKISKSSIIGIAADRSVYAVAGMLGAIKAGRPYVGIDPHYPKDRIEFIIKDTKTPVLAGFSKTLNNIKFDGIKLSLDNLPNSLSNSNPKITPSEKTPAYIIFTSGSTGIPKGVVIEHHSMVNFIDWYIRRCSISPDDKCAEFAAFSFDVSVVQVFAPLAAGAELVVVPENLRRNPMELNEFYEEHHVTHTHFPTRFAEQFIRACSNSSLKKMVVGGDALRNYSLKSYELINEYGPSETTMASTAYTVSSNLKKVPIGKPIANTQIYILDKYLKPRPIGFPGELFIAGAGVSRGYLNRPELTKEKFIDNPFKPGTKMFKTGDMAKLLPDGNIDFIGRVDFQVKIRGYRVEPGEIDKSLLEHPKISEVVTVAVQQLSGDKSLCSYFISETSLSRKMLVNHLSERLPEYMIPTYFMQLKQLPVNRNGKIDRNALPVPTLSPVNSKSAQPTNEKETRIKSVWTSVLGFDNIGIHDDFFASGGDSLKAIVLALELQVFLKITTNDVFTFKTIAQQADNLDFADGNISTRLEKLKELANAPLPEPDNSDKMKLEKYYTQVENLNSSKIPEIRDPEHLLLTGATGTLGAYILMEFIRNKKTKITAIVRAKTNKLAKERLLQRINYSFPNVVSLPKNLQVIKGDLTCKQFDLDDEIYNELIISIDSIIHSAADTRHAGNYEIFYKNNVFATENLLLFAKQGKKHPVFNYISTVSVAAGSIKNRDTVVFTENDMDMGQKCSNVYVRSKLEAEKRVATFRDNGNLANIFRVGNITMDSDTGIFQSNIESNAFFQQLKAYINLGATPFDCFSTRNMTFVNKAAEAISKLASIFPAHNKTFHIENPFLANLSDLLTDPCLNLNINKISFSEFVDLLIKHYHHNGFKVFLERLMTHLGWNETLEGVKYTSFIRKSDYTQTLLQKLGFQWPKPSPKHLDPLVSCALAERQSFFESLKLFENLENDILKTIVRNSSMQITESGFPVFRENREFTKTVIIAEGMAEINRMSKEGWISTMLMRGSGSVLALSALKPDHRPAATCEAFDDLLWYAIDNHILRNCILKSPILSSNIINILAEDLENLAKMIAALG